MPRTRDSSWVKKRSRTIRKTLKRFDENLHLNQRAYQERAIELADALLFQNQVVEARLKFIDALTNYNLSLAELRFQAGIE